MIILSKIHTSCYGDDARADSLNLQLTIFNKMFRLHLDAAGSQTISKSGKSYKRDPKAEREEIEDCDGRLVLLTVTDAPSIEDAQVGTPLTFKWCTAR